MTTKISMGEIVLWGMHCRNVEAGGQPLLDAFDLVAPVPAILRHPLHDRFEWNDADRAARSNG